MKSSLTQGQRRVMRLLIIIYVLSAALWAAIYFTSPESKKSTVLWLAIFLFGFSFLGVGLLMLIYKHFNKSKPK
jgi:predicted membrane protein